MINTQVQPQGNASTIDDMITSSYTERYTLFEDQKFKNLTKEHKIETESVVPKLGLMIVGLGGNNGSTLTAGLLANKHNVHWETKKGMNKPNFYGSFTQAATTHCGYKFDEKSGHLEDVHLPIKDILPMANPIDFVVSGWDISALNLYDSCKRAQVMEPDLVNKLEPYLKDITPLPAAFNGDYIAANQSDRVNNIMKGNNAEKITQIREDIRYMKNKCDKVIVLWSANTEMFLKPEIKTIDELKTRITEDQDLPASVLYCVAAIEEKILYLNGSPQNTFHPAIVEYAKQNGAFIAGSDFKSGQTRFKTMMSDF